MESVKMSNTVINGARQAIYTARKRMKDYKPVETETKETGLLQRPEKKQDKDDPFIEDLIMRIRNTNA
tara:strand:- start:683 stop:886 length:204 start_codon:yes stop_codon:yes gene_type:complete